MGLILAKDSIFGDQKNSHGKPKEDAALFKMKGNNSKKCGREKLHHSRIFKFRESEDLECPFFLSSEIKLLLITFDAEVN